MKPDIALIGPGKVGCAFSRQLQLAGYPIVAVIGRNQNRAVEACRFIGCAVDSASTELSRALQARLILIAVPDDEITRTVETLCHEQQLKGRTLIHFSGLHPSSCMQADAAATLSIHPLLSFADRNLAVQRLQNCPCALEGDSNSLSLGRALIRAVGGIPFSIRTEKKALYHTAACITSNHLVALLESASEILEECGIDTEPLTLLMPLIKATIDNVDRLGTSRGLTGPIVRGDIQTVSQHIETLKQLSPQNLAAYLTMAQKTLALAKKSERLDPADAEQIQRRLTETWPAGDNKESST